MRLECAANPVCVERQTPAAATTIRWRSNPSARRLWGMHAPTNPSKPCNRSIRMPDPTTNDPLVRAAIAATRAIKHVDPQAKFVCAEPLIHVAAAPDAPQDVPAAEHKRLSQYESIDLLTGRLEPELGGSRDLLDVIGVNFYSD